MNEMNTQVIYGKYQFWIVLGIMIYLAGSFFIYVFASQVDRRTLNEFWYLTNVFYILKNILFATGIIIFFNQKKNSPPAPEFRPYLN
jgi:hypothetical protein